MDNVSNVAKNHLSSFMNLKVVQQGAKSFALGSILVASYYVLTKVAGLSKNSDASLKAFKEEMPQGMHPTLDLIATHDQDYIDLMLRLLCFRKFNTQSYDEIVVTIALALQIHEKLYAKKPVTHTASFQVRKAFQNIIERIRLLRAILEIKVPTTLDDFDEVAVDLNAKVEQTCNDAIQDSSLE